ncbi:MAG: hypothetical protein ACR2JC_18465 [Chloroflexota bacterium]
MTTTVTTTTVTTVTALGLTGALGAIITVALIALLVFKEIAGTAAGERTVRWGRTLSIGSTPLAVAFAVIVLTRLTQLG